MSFEIYLSPPHMTGNEQRFIQEAFDTNWVAPLGPHVEAFEREIENYLGTDIHALALSSGTAAIHLGLRSLGVGPGDWVVCQSFTFIGTANPILYCGGKPVFVDSEPESWNMSPTALEKALNSLRSENRPVKAVILVNLYGQSSNMHALLSVCEKFGVPVLEDAAESLGATYQGRKSGTFGNFSILSFNGNKIITTSGGGALLSHDSQSIAKARFWATQARDPAPYYQHSEMGYNYRLSNVLAGLGRAQLEALDERVKLRRAVFNRYREAFQNLPGVSFMPEAEFGHSTRWLTVMTIDPSRSKLRPLSIIEHLAKLRIEARPAWKPLHLQPLFQECPFYSDQPRGSLCERLFQTGICLPSGSNLSLSQQNRVTGEILRLNASTGEFG